MPGTPCAQVADSEQDRANGAPLARIHVARVRALVALRAATSSLANSKLREVHLDFLQIAHFGLIDRLIEPVLMENANSDRN